MARPASPEYAEKLGTGVSAEEREQLERIARVKRVKVAAVLRWAVEEYLARHTGKEGDGGNGKAG